MKLNISKTAFYLLFGMGLFTMLGCVKNNDKTFTDFSTVTDLVILQKAGLSNFAAANIIITPSSADTLSFDVYADLASVYAVNNNIVVTLGIDDTQRTAYNAANSTSYLAFTSSMYKLASNTITIPAGGHYAKTTLQIFKKAVDLSKSWFLAVGITDASGKALSSNQNAILFHIIGNPMAGDYKVTGVRNNYNGGATTGTPASVADLATTKTALPISSTVVAIDYANLGGSAWQYLVTFNAAYTQIVSVLPNATITDPANAGGTFALTAPTTFDPVTKTIGIHSTYTNAAGNARTVDETFVKQ